MEVAVLEGEDLILFGEHERKDAAIFDIIICLPFGTYY